MMKRPWDGGKVDLGAGDAAYRKAKVKPAVPVPAADAVPIVALV